MKKPIIILAVLFMVLIGFTVIAQKPEWINLKEKRSNRNNQHFNEWKSKSQKDAIQTKGLISKPSISEDYYWNETYWVFSSITEYSYNEKGFITEELVTYTNSGQNDKKRTWVYDSLDNQIETIAYNWINGFWEISYGSKTLYTYDENGNYTQRIGQHWEEGEWVNIAKDNYEYDSNGFEIIWIYQEWENGILIPRWKHEHTVGNQGEWTEHIVSYWGNNQWYYGHKSIDIVWYNWEQNQLQSYLEQTWEGEWINDERYNATFTADNYIGVYEEYNNNSWVNFERKTYTHFPTEHITKYEDFENNNWINSSKGTDFYNDHGKYIGHRTEGWIYENEEWKWVIGWENSYSFTYNENNDITEEVLMYLSSETYELENSSRHVYSIFQHFESSVNNNISIGNVKVFPNPVGDILIIDIQNKNLTEAVVQIMSITGQKVYEGVLSGQFTSINTNSLSKGVYILHIQTTDNRILNYKIMKD